MPRKGDEIAPAARGPFPAGNCELGRCGATGHEWRSVEGAGRAETQARSRDAEPSECGACPHLRRRAERSFRLVYVG
jgi:hypothetical protein